jgi:hypothetical protein
MTVRVQCKPVLRMTIHTSTAITASCCSGPKGRAAVDDLLNTADVKALVADQHTALTAVHGYTVERTARPSAHARAHESPHAHCGDDAVVTRASSGTGADVASELVDRNYGVTANSARVATICEVGSALFAKANR